MEFMQTPDAAPDSEEGKRRAGEVERTANEFLKAFQQGRIWLSPSTCAMLEKMWNEAKLVAYMMLDSRTDIRAAGEARRKLRTEIPNGIDALEREFGRIVGTRAWYHRRKRPTRDPKSHENG